MKTNDIEVGKRYTDGVTVREVVWIGLTGSSKGLCCDYKDAAGNEARCKLKVFGEWAKGEVKP